MLKIYFLIFTIYSLPSLALKETDISFVYELLDNKKFYQQGEFKGEGDVKLRYARFGKKRGKEGALVFVNGRAENLFKYIELFYDLHLKGWSPIYTYDHRGQGFSDRLYSPSNMGHVEDYSYYRKDLKTFLDIVKSDPQVGKSPLFLIAHSMGGLIAVDYLQNYKDPGFKALVLSAPMFRISITASAVFDYLSFLFCSLFPCSSKNLKEENKNSVLTNSKAREDFFIYLKKKRFPESKLGPPSVPWLIKSFKRGRKSIRPKEIQKIKMPILILQGEQDVVVSNEQSKEFCKVIPQNCELKIFDGKHELFIEKDPVRDQVIAEVLQFFSKHKRP